MESYLVIKLIHILSAVVITGTGAGIAFFMFMANRTRNIEVIAITAKHVILADWLFTFPAVVTQFITGVWLMELLNYAYTSVWFLTVISLFIFIGMCWLPVIYLQYKLKEYSDQALIEGTLSARYTKTMNVWTALGVPAFITVIVIFWLMIFKPLPVL